MSSFQRRPFLNFFPNLLRFVALVNFLFGLYSVFIGGTSDVIVRHCRSHSEKSLYIASITKVQTSLLLKLYYVVLRNITIHCKNDERYKFMCRTRLEKMTIAKMGKKDFGIFSYHRGIARKQQFLKNRMK